MGIKMIIDEIQNVFRFYRINQIRKNVNKKLPYHENRFMKTVIAFIGLFYAIVLTISDNALLTAFFLISLLVPSNRNL